MTLLAASARRRTAPDPEPTGPPTLAFTDTATALIADGSYNAFPGVVTCPNGDILAAYRNGLAHFQGRSLYTIRSTDGGATWGEPQLVAEHTGTYGWGTATLSIVGSQIALVSWIRPLGGGTPYPDSTRIFLSSDNGATWDTPLTVDTGPSWLGTHSVSESPLLYDGGHYYLGVWGVDAGEPTNYFQSGVMRSADLDVWERVALYDSGTGMGFNECGVARIGANLVCIIRHEGNGRYASTSTDGQTWTAPQWLNSPSTQGAPKMATATMLGHNLVPLRTSGGGGFMAAVNSAGTIANVADLGLPSNTFMYGQVCRFTNTTGAVVYSQEVTSNRADLYYRPFTLTAI